MGLQWSHVFSDMEIDNAGRAYLCVVFWASMEPRLLRHGNPRKSLCPLAILVKELQWSHVFSDMEIGGPTSWIASSPITRASMEPRLLRHGNGGERHGRISSYNSCASMEPRLLRHGNQKTEYYSERVAANALQWSHVFSDMEIRVLGRKAAGAGVGGFNGATSSQTWK